MKYLLTALWGIGIIMLIGILKIVVHNFLPDELPFIYNFFSLAQLIVLFWTMLSLIPRPARTHMSIIKKAVLIFFLFGLPELVLLYYLNHPEKIPVALKPSFQYYYSQSASDIIQFNANYSVYNSGLFYTLKPSSHFIFKNYEFADSFNTNSLGLRDDENSLLSPDIICLGDSYAMGWGVAQHETFAEILGKQSGKKVLNAAMSSYGTARELKTLSRLDTSNLKYIIIQYCRNDFNENKTFVDSGYSLTISPEIKYISTVNNHYWNRYWFPGKHVTAFSKLNASRKLPAFFNFRNKPVNDSLIYDIHKAAVTFTDLLARSSINFQKVKVFVIDLNEKQLLNDDFINEINILKNTPEFRSRFNNNLIMVPVTGSITEKDYYVLDAHLRTSGHRKIAALLNSLISNTGFSQ